MMFFPYNSLRFSPVPIPGVSSSFRRFFFYFSDVRVKSRSLVLSRVVNDDEGVISDAQLSDSFSTVVLRADYLTVPEVSSFISRKSGSNRIFISCFILGARAYSFISPDTKEMVSGVKVMTTNTLEMDKPDVKGLVIEPYTLKVSNPQQIAAKFKELPAPYILEFQVSGGKNKLINFYSIEALVRKSSPATAVSLFDSLFVHTKPSSGGVPSAPSVKADKADKAPKASSPKPSSPKPSSPKPSSPTSTGSTSENPSAGGLNE